MALRQGAVVFIAQHSRNRRSNHGVVVNSSEVGAIATHTIDAIFHMTWQSAQENGKLGLDAAMIASALSFRLSELFQNGTLRNQMRLFPHSLHYGIAN